MMLTLNRSKQRGISLLEVLLSLAVIAIILVMATRYYKSAQQSQQIVNAVSMIGGIVTAQTQYAAANNNKYADNLSALSSAGYLPANFGTDPWGGNITLSSVTSGFAITMTTPSAELCKILAGMINSGATNNATAECGTGGTITATYN